VSLPPSNFAWVHDKGFQISFALRLEAEFDLETEFDPRVNLYDGAPILGHSAGLKGGCYLLSCSQKEGWKFLYNAAW